MPLRFVLVIVLAVLSAATNAETVTDEPRYVVLSLIGDVLDFSKIEAGMLQLDEDEVDVRGLLSGVAELLCQRGYDKNVELTAIVAPQVPHVIRADENRIHDLMERSLMLVTALAPKIGYDNAAKVAKSAHARGTTLKEEAVRLGFVNAVEFERLVQPGKMTHPG